MSEENVQVVRRMYDAFERGDFDSALAHFDPNIEWDEPPDNPGARKWHGRNGVERALATWMGAFEDYRYELRELIDCGDDMVLLAAWQSGRGKASGVQVSEENFCVFTVRDGKIVRQQMFRHPDEALEAAGLQE
jgi:ketosteroid isomerase-like protein